MKKFIYALILPLIVVSGLVFANRGLKNETSKTSTPKPLSAAERKTEKEKWEATPDGITYKKWEASPAGKKVYAGEAKIRNHLSAFTNMEAVVTSLSLPPGSRLGFGVMVRINGDDYIVKFEPEKPQFEICIDYHRNSNLAKPACTTSKATLKQLQSDKKYQVRVAVVGTNEQLLYSDPVWKTVQ